MSFDWTSAILGFCSGVLVIILLATLARSIFVAIRKRRGLTRPAPEFDGAHEAAELHRREQLERGAIDVTPRIGNNMAGIGGPS